MRRKRQRAAALRRMRGTTSAELCRQVTPPKRGRSANRKQRRGGEDGLRIAGRGADQLQHPRGRVCCSSASVRCFCASAGSRLQASYCSRSAGGVRIGSTRVFAFVLAERSLRPCVWLFAPLRDNAIRPISTVRAALETTGRTEGVRKIAERFGVVYRALRSARANNRLSVAQPLCLMRWHRHRRTWRRLRCACHGWL
jgi:hypothetical protein